MNLPPRLVSHLLLACAIVAPCALAQDSSRITRHPIRGPLHWIDGAVDVVGVSAGPDGVLLVDIGYPETFAALDRAIVELGHGTPKLLINTHWHHTFANFELQGRVPIIAHRNVWERLGHADTMYNRLVPEAPSASRPTITFDDSLTLHFNGEAITVLHLPRAHTDGDVAVIFEQSHVAFAGDVIVTGIPSTDYPTGGTLRGLVAAVDRLLARLPHDAIVVPGHGRPMTYEEVEGYRSMLSGIIDSISARRGARETMAESRQQGIPAPWRSYPRVLPDEFVLDNLYEGLEAWMSGRPQIPGASPSPSRARIR